MSKDNAEKILFINKCIRNGGITHCKPVQVYSGLWSHYDTWYGKFTQNYIQEGLWIRSCLYTIVLEIIFYSYPADVYRKIILNH